jgi:hypothetical protein
LTQPSSSRPADETFQTIRRSASVIGDVAEGWILRADAERRYHFRSDHEKLDEMLSFLVENSLIFGEDD